MPGMLGCLLRAMIAMPRRPEQEIRVAEVHRQSGRLKDSFGLPITR